MPCLADVAAKLSHQAFKSIFVKLMGVKEVGSLGEDVLFELLFYKGSTLS